MISLIIFRIALDYADLMWDIRVILLILNVLT